MQSEAEATTITLRGCGRRLDDAVYKNLSMHCLSPRVAMKKRTNESFAKRPLNSLEHSCFETCSAAFFTAALRGRAE